MANEWWVNILWIVAAAALGYFVAWYFTGKLRFKRQHFLVPYVVLSSALFVGFLLWNGTDVWNLFAENLVWGILAAAIIGVFLVFSVMRQPRSPRLHGGKLAGDIVWSGLVYGTIDGILLSVIPVMAVKNAVDDLGWESDFGSSLLIGALAILSSAFVTAVYHLGFREFRNRSVILPVFALALGSAGYLLAANPFAVIGSHAAMHVAAVIRGPERTVQLPPHYHSSTDASSGPQQK